MKISQLILLAILCLSLMDSHERRRGRYRARRRRYERLKKLPREELDTEDLEFVEGIEKQQREAAQREREQKERQEKYNKTPEGIREAKRFRVAEQFLEKRRQAQKQLYAKFQKEAGQRNAWAQSPEGRKKIAAWREEAYKAGWRVADFETWNGRQRWADYDSNQNVFKRNLGWKLRDKIDFTKVNPWW